MPWDGAGNYTPAPAPNFPAVGTTTISSAYYNNTINDIANALNNCLTRDGFGKPSGDTNWNNKNLSNVNVLGVNGAGTFGGLLTANAGLTVTGAVNLGGTVTITANNTPFYLTDTSGSHPQLLCTSGNVLQLLGTNSVGAAISLIRWTMRINNPSMSVDTPLSVNGPLQHSAVTNVASLPNVATYLYGRTFVVDATTTNFGTIVAGGGTNVVPVYSDGTNWRIG